ncbi:MAG: hypothetical protein B1H09_07925 [Gemmatimonadaceae bacterium 4484_173]|nr:MAG: hypothetical protein B1H09_07925 [Gemmatimonadaceae bacterium 4484_173]RKZ02764.1 MAG: hypothetical protein DRQ21_07665 [Candidatus Fermentibacteria bacterium]
MAASVLKLFLLTVLTVVFVSCESAPSDGEIDTESSTQVDSLIPIDSIGVLMGDSSYMLGSIADFTMFPDGEPAILDRVKGTVSVFDSNGVFLNSFGRLGEGPGEFQYPFAMTRLSSGLVVVAELMGKMTVFDGNGDYVSSWTMEGLGGLPLQLTPFDDSTLVAYWFTMKMNDDGFGINYSLNRYNAVTGEEVTEYFNWFGESNSSTDFTPAYLVTASDGEGTLYLSRVQSESWMVEVYGEEAQPLDTISVFPQRQREVAPDSTPVPGVVPVSYMVSDGEGNTEQSMVNMPEFHPFISALGVDGEGNIWCCRGGLPGNIWDVVSPEGYLVKEVAVSLPDSAYYIDTDISPYGVLACDIYTEDFQKLYIMGN